MDYKILREDGKNVLWLNGQFIGSVSDEVAERIHQAAQQSVQADDCPSCAGSGKKEIGGMLLTCLACDGTGKRH